MCGRFFVATDDPELEDIILALERESERMGRKLPPIRRGEVFPTNHAAVQAGKGKNPYAQMQWGFKHFKGTGVIINARSETAGEKPTFRKPLQESRCLIPATCYYEWQTDGNKKTRNIMRDPKERRIYMAGLFRQESEVDVPRFVILTRAAAVQIRSIHDRMPVILDAAGREEWLSDSPDVDNVLRGAVDRIIGEPTGGL